jgi:hypothetical protein
LWRTEDSFAVWSKNSAMRTISSVPLGKLKRTHGNVEEFPTNPGESLVQNAIRMFVFARLNQRGKISKKKLEHNQAASL